MSNVQIYDRHPLTDLRCEIVFTDADKVAIDSSDGYVHHKAWMTWEELRDAAQDNGMLTDFYKQTLSAAIKHRANHRKIYAVSGGLTDTNVWGILGLGEDANWAPIRWYHNHHCRVDEGQDLYTSEHAAEEAQQYAERLKILYVPERFREDEDNKKWLKRWASSDSLDRIVWQYGERLKRWA